MLKLLIADDEPKIRRGLSQAIDWQALGIEVAGFAENGRKALERAQEIAFDLCLVDISMPVVSGLDFIEQMRILRPDMLCIVVTGHDEFEYAQKSVVLNVFEYLLKPLNAGVLEDTVRRAVETIRSRTRETERLERALALVNKNLSILREQFLSELIAGVLSTEEIEAQEAMLGMQGDPGYALNMMPIEPKAAEKSAQERQLARLTVQGCFQNAYGADAVVVFDNYDNLVALTTKVRDAQGDTAFAQLLSEELGLAANVTTYALEALSEAPDRYAQWLDICQKGVSPIILSAMRYIDDHYRDAAFGMGELTQVFHISAGYLSRMFRQETGMTFIEYLIGIRIRKAALLLEMSDLRVYEVADRVGYSSQHYFCAAFKRVLGVSPSEYREKGGSNHGIA
ncbi:MAG: response regulator [Clostridia bacterium]